MKKCSKCESTEFKVVPVDNIHKIMTICKECEVFIQFGRISEELEDGQHEFIVKLAEEVNNTFILFKLTNEVVSLKKQIWKNEQGNYYINLKRFIITVWGNVVGNIRILSIEEVLKYLKGKKVIATVENVTRKGKRICEVKSIDKIL